MVRKCCWMNWIGNEGVFCKIENWTEEVGVNKFRIKVNCCCLNRIIFKVNDLPSSFILVSKWFYELLIIFMLIYYLLVPANWLYTPFWPWDRVETTSILQPPQTISPNLHFLEFISLSILNSQTKLLCVTLRGPIINNYKITTLAQPTYHHIIHNPAQH